MSYLPVLILAAGLVANIAIYKRQHRRFGTRDSGRVEKRSYAASRPTRLFRHVKYALYLAALAYLLLNPLVLNPVQPSPARLLLGALVGVSGLVLLFLSLEALGENYAPCDQGVLPRSRVRHGPYRTLKHPMYVANILQLVGAAIVSFGALIVVLILVYSCFVALIAREENAALDRHFPV